MAGISEYTRERDNSFVVILVHSIDGPDAY
jgi:hypothetical protein